MLNSDRFGQHLKTRTVRYKQMARRWVVHAHAADVGDIGYTHADLRAYAKLNISRWARKEREWCSHAAQP